MKDAVRNFIVTTFMHGEGALDDDDQIFEKGIIDSLGFIKLLSFIENRFKVSIDMSEVSMDKFGSISDIVRTIESKVKG